MEMMQLGAVEMRFAELIWEYAPIGSGELVTLCQKELNWKKSTTYTVLRKLCQRGLFQNIGGCVSVVITKEEYRSLQSTQFVDGAFAGSLPAFLAAFTSKKALTEKEIDEIQAMIDSYKES